MSGTEAWGLFLLLLSGFAAGGINAVAGGGTILTFAVLSAILPPGPGRLVTANVTSKIGLWPGAAAAAWAYRGSREKQPAWGKWLILPSGIGAVLGVVLLRVLPKESFDVVVPWLILGAALLFALQPQITRLVLMLTQQQERGKSVAPAAAVGLGSATAGSVAAAASTEASPLPAIAPRSLPAGRFAVVLGLQLLVGIYGGYFGAGIGILMLGTLAILGLGDVHALNASKNLLGAVVNGVSGIVLVAVALAGGFRVSWLHVAILAVGGITGGYVVSHAAQRLPAALVRRLVAIIAFALAGYHFWREWTG